MVKKSLSCASHNRNLAFVIAHYESKFARQSSGEKFSLRNALSAQVGKNIAKHAKDIKRIYLGVTGVFTDSLDLDVLICTHDDLAAVPTPVMLWLRFFIDRPVDYSFQMQV